MLTRNDCLLLLSDLQEQGIETKPMLNKVLQSKSVDTTVLEFIHKNKTLDIINFYIKLRKSYNSKKSKLYKEIVQIDEKQPKDIIITLSSLLTQIFLFSNQVEDKQLFLKHSRADEISKVLVNYCKNYDTTLCLQLLSLIRADLKALESVNININI